MLFHFEFQPFETDVKAEPVPFAAEFSSISMAVWQAQWAMKFMLFSFGLAERCVITSEDRTFTRVTMTARDRDRFGHRFLTRGVAIRPFVMF
jgi:hypothetical protein